MNGERPVGLKMAWDAAALLDKAIHVSYFPYKIKINEVLTKVRVFSDGLGRR